MIEGRPSLLLLLSEREWAAIEEKIEIEAHINEYREGFWGAVWMRLSQCDGLFVLS